MSFLAPLFLLGTLAVALPVVFHLIRRTTRERTVFSSLMFLAPTPPRLTRRSQIEHLFLLLLRCLAICLLALCFARPFLKQAISNEPDAAAAKSIIVLVDISASMRRGNLWPEARAQAEAVLRKAAVADEAALFTFDREMTPLVTFAEWNGLPAGERAAVASGKLAQVSPGWFGTHLGRALISAAESLSDAHGKARQGPRQIVLISDLQEGSRLEALQGYEWPRGVELSIVPLSPRRASNASLQWINEADDTGSQAGANARVRVSNAADSRREQFHVGWARADGHSFVGEAAAVYVPPGQSRVVALPLLTAGETVDRIMLQGDDDDFDNTVFLVPPETERLTVLYFGSETPEDSKQPLYFLQRAFQKTRRQTVQVLARSPEALIPPNEAQTAILFFVSDSLSQENAGMMREQVASGKTVFVTLKTAAAAPTLARLLGLNGIAVEEAHPSNYAMLADIDFRHPLFAPFADPRFSDFTKIHFWKYRRLEAGSVPQARAIAKFDSGDPALLEIPVGKGRLLVLTSGWHPADSQLALSTKFVPLLYALLDTAGARPASAAQFYAGDIVPLGPLVGASDAAWTLRSPDGSESKLSPGQTNFSGTTMPGIYTLSSGQSTKRFAVNLDPSESRTTPLPPDELERLGAPVLQAAAPMAREAARKVRLQNAELENRQKLWRLVLIATLAVLLFETWMAGRASRRLAMQPGTAVS